MATSGWQLVMQQGPQVGQTFDLNKPVVTIGREANNDIVIEDPQISRHHARLTQQGAGYVIEDLGSTNGTFINGQRVLGTRPLSGGDALGLGDTVVLKVMGVAGAGETVVARAQPQPQPTLVPSYGAPPPPPPSYSAPPPPLEADFGAPPPPPPLPQKKGPSCWVWGCGCTGLLLACLILFALFLILGPRDMTYPINKAIIDFFASIGLPLPLAP